MAHSRRSSRTAACRQNRRKLRGPRGRVMLKNGLGDSGPSTIGRSDICRRSLHVTCRNLPRHHIMRGTARSPSNPERNFRHPRRFFSRICDSPGVSVSAEVNHRCPVGKESSGDPRPYALPFASSAAMISAMFARASTSADRKCRGCGNGGRRHFTGLQSEQIGNNLEENRRFRGRSSIG